MSEKVESIALTGRDESAVWINKEGKAIIMSDMEDTHIQSAIIITQKRQVDGLNALLFAEKLELQLLQEARNRNLKVQSIDELKDTTIAKKYGQNKELLKTIFRSIKRKIKSLSNVKEEINQA
jgi:hypothetical protein